MSYYQAYYPGYWEGYQPKHENFKSLLSGSGKSKRSSSEFASFGIRALALDFPMEGVCDSGIVANDLHKRLKERYQTYEEYELDWKRKIERSIKRKEEKKRREREEEKERKEKEEQEKVNNAILFSNGFSSTFVDLNMQEIVEEIPKETSYELPSLKQKCVDIIPSAPLCTQPSFGSQTHERNEEKHMESYGGGEPNNRFEDESSRRGRG